MDVCKKINDCIRITENPNIVLRDRLGGKSEYRIENKERTKVSIIDFEGCVFEEDETKCDFGVLINSDFYYIELKGKQVEKGLKQLNETLVKTEKCFNKNRLNAHLVVTGFGKPNIVRKNIAYKQLSKKLGQLHNEGDRFVIKETYSKTI